MSVDTVAGAAVADDGERLKGAGKGAVTGFVGGATLSPRATVGTAATLGLIDGAIDGATDGDPNTSAAGSGLGQGVADGLSALGGVGASNAAQDELQELGASAIGSVVGAELADGQSAKELGNAAVNHLAEAPLYPNAGSVTLPSNKAPVSSDFLRCTASSADKPGC